MLFVARPYKSNRLPSYEGSGLKLADGVTVVQHGGLPSYEGSGLK